ncbi:MAG: hypothetical protein GF384_08795, partial [Elusimicrobia bacterium]|nr:hypothetical protein [Elusimicrobiota bacterium]
MMHCKFCLFIFVFLLSSCSSVQYGRTVKKQDPSPSRVYTDEYNVQQRLPELTGQKLTQEARERTINGYRFILSL